MLLALWCSMAVVTASPPRFDQKVFAERAKQIKVGTTIARVRELLGEPHEQLAEPTRWIYRNPPHQPDGPYHQYTFTLEKQKVTRIEESGVACSYRE